MTFPVSISAPARTLVARATDLALTVGTAESCTGGLVAAAITSVEGSSAIFPGAIISYGDDVKSARLGVPETTLMSHGAVSEETARAMLSGLFEALPIDLGVSITGIAGPGGGGADKPVGLVHFAAGSRSGSVITVAERFGEIGRHAVRLKSVERALALLLQMVESGVRA